jgi:hypothetical protein
MIFNQCFSKRHSETLNLITEIKVAPVDTFELAIKMATKTSKVGRLLQKHKTAFSKDIDINRIVSKLTQRGALNKKEEEVILECGDQKQKGEIFMDILSEKGSRFFHEFCAVLEECAPHLLTRFLLDASPGILSYYGIYKISTLTGHSLLIHV